MGSPVDGGRSYELPASSRSKACFAVRKCKRIPKDFPTNRKIQVRFNKLEVWFFTTHMFKKWYNLVHDCLKSIIKLRIIHCILSIFIHTI